MQVNKSREDNAGIIDKNGVSRWFFISDPSNGVVDVTMTVPFDIMSPGVSIVPRRDHEPATAHPGLRNSAAARTNLAKPKSLAISVLLSRGAISPRPRASCRMGIYHGRVDHGTEQPRSLAGRSLSGDHTVARASRQRCSRSAAQPAAARNAARRIVRQTGRPTRASAGKVNRISQELRTRTQEVRPKMFPAVRTHSTQRIDSNFKSLHPGAC